MDSFYELKDQNFMAEDLFTPDPFLNRKLELPGWFDDYYYSMDNFLGLSYVPFAESTLQVESIYNYDDVNFNGGFNSLPFLDHQNCYNFQGCYNNFEDFPVLDVQPLNAMDCNNNNSSSICVWNNGVICDPRSSEVLSMEKFPCGSSGNHNNVSEENKEEIFRRRVDGGKGSSKCNALGFEEIAKYFDMPITKAAKRLKIGLTALKKRCRELKIERWPHRKIQSLKSLIQNLKEMGLSRMEIQKLEEHKKLMEKMPELALSERTKKLRQACFKANYKKRRAFPVASCSI